MRTYVRGNQFPQSIASTLSKAGLKKYWLVDVLGNPIGKPFSRRSEVELYEASIEGDYQIITGKVGRPRIHSSAQDKEKARESKRKQNAKRKEYKAAWIRAKQSYRQPKSSQLATTTQVLPG